jgi:hypothetical protein
MQRGIGHGIFPTRVALEIVDFAHRNPEPHRSLRLQQVKPSFRAPPLFLERASGQ